MKRIVVRINVPLYERFMKIQLAKSGKSFGVFAESLGVCANTLYAWKYKKRIKYLHYLTLKRKYGTEVGFDECFKITEEYHGNTKKVEVLA